MTGSVEQQHFCDRLNSPALSKKKLVQLGEGSMSVVLKAHVGSTELEISGDLGSEVGQAEQPCSGG